MFEHIVIDIRHSKTSHKFSKSNNNNYGHTCLYFNMSTYAIFCSVHEGRSQLLINVPNNKSNQKEQRYTITVSVPPTYKCNKEEDEGGKVHQLHISKLKNNNDDESKNITIGNCIVCWDKTCNCSFCPCGHVTTCYECAVLLYLTRDGCPVCRQYVTHIQPLYFSCQK